MPDRRRALYVTDLAYQARGRRYCDEDIFLTSRLRDDFDVALCHPLDAAALMDAFDVVGLDRVLVGLGEQVQVLGPVDGGDDRVSGGGQIQ